MFCSNCGAEISDGAAFCPKCGTALGTPQPPAAPEPVATPESATTVMPVEPTQAYAPVEPATTVMPSQPTQAYTPVAPVTPTEPAATYSYEPVQPTQVVPQPVATQPPTSGASAQPSYTAQPAQASYGYQPGVPQQPAKKKLPVAGIVIGVIAVLAIIFAVMNFLGGSDEPEPSPSGQGGGLSIEVPDLPDTPEPSDTPETPDTPEVTTPEPSGTATYPDEALDAKGNPTAYADLEMSGSDIVAMLEGEGWSWNDNKLWFTSSDNNDCFYVSGPNDYEYTYDEIKALATFGGSDPVVYVTVVDDRDYSSASDALSKLTPVVVEDIEWIDDEQTTALVALYGPSMKETIALVSYNDDPGLYVIDVFNPAAIEQGMIDEWLGDNYGRSVDEIWQTLFDSTPGN